MTNINKIIINKPHSIIDLITNSSTEIFVIDDIDTEVDFVKEIINEIIETYNKANKTDISFSDWFSEPYYNSWGDENGSGITLEGVYDNSIPYWFMELLPELFVVKSRLHR